MKLNKAYRYGIMAGTILAMTACSEESIFEPTQAGIPVASDYKMDIKVDDLNNVEINILTKDGSKATGVYPIWYVNGSKNPSTSLTYRNLLTIMGDYPVSMKVGNANGVSEGAVNGTIVIPKTIFDFTPYMEGLTNGDSKEWVIDGTKDHNMGCGSGPDNPTEWWDGGPGCKEAEGVYENSMIFGYTGSDTEGSYTFEPGASGTVYVNTGVNALTGLEVNNPGDSNDFRVAASAMSTTFTLVPEGANLYLTLPAYTLFPYIPSEAGFDNPKYRIASFSKKEVTLVQDLEGISWQYIIAPKPEADVTKTGFKYDGEHNLWKDANVSVEQTLFFNQDWMDLPSPEVEVTPAKGIKFHSPAETGGDQWQAQVHVSTDIQINAGKTYDFSCKVKVPEAGAVTVKVQNKDDDQVYFAGMGDKKDVDAVFGGSVVWFSDLEGFDGTVKIAFDFGGFADADIEVTDIVIKEHQYDDGTNIPAVEEAPEIADADNLFASYEVVKYSTWFAAAGWDDGGCDEPEINFASDGYSFVAPANIGGDQWHGQVHMWTDVKTSSENKYDFMLTIESDKDIPGVTVKIQKGDSLGEDTKTDDNAYFVADRVDVDAGVPCVYFFKGKKGIDTENLQVCMDYAGAPEGAQVKVSGIKMQVSK